MSNNNRHISNAVRNTRALALSSEVLSAPEPQSLSAALSSLALLAFLDHTADKAMGKAMQRRLMSTVAIFKNI